LKGSINYTILDEMMKQRADDLLQMWEAGAETKQNWKADLWPISAVIYCAASVPRPLKFLGRESVNRVNWWPQTSDRWDGLIWP